MLIIASYPNADDIAEFKDIAFQINLNAYRAFLVACLKVRFLHYPTASDQIEWKKSPVQLLLWSFSASAWRRSCKGSNSRGSMCEFDGDFGVQLANNDNMFALDGQYRKRSSKQRASNAPSTAAAEDADVSSNFFSGRIIPVILETLPYTTYSSCFSSSFRSSSFTYRSVCAVSHHYSSSKLEFWLTSYRFFSRGLQHLIQ